MEKSKQELTQHFTAEELMMLSNSVIGMIDRTNEASKVLGMYMDTTNTAEILTGQLVQLNNKICDYMV